MKAIIVEDKENIRKALLHLLGSITNEVDVIGECASVKDAVIVAKACKPELVFLDINLLDGTGFDFLDQTEDLSFKVIFITAYGEFALQALKAGAVDYLLKPVDVEELKLALEKVNKLAVETQQKQIQIAKKILNPDVDSIVLSLLDTFQVVELRELMYCESDKGYTTFYLENGKKHLASKPIKEFEEHLLNHSFIRCHQSFMVNSKFIDRYEKSGTIILKNNIKIPVSTRKKDSIVDFFFKWKK